MAAVLAVIVYTEHANAAATINVWMLTHDVAAGSAYTTPDVQLVQIKATDGDFSYEKRGPNEVSARYAHAMTAHDILRSDDLVLDSMLGEVALTVQNPPPLNPGDHVDIYAALTTNEQALVGHDVIVETVSGGSLTVLVRAQDEAAWVAVASSNVALHAARTVPGSQVQREPMSADSAIRLLCGPACAQASTPRGGTP
jgi:hypothetical protein